MKPLTSEWVDKAEGDFITCRYALRGMLPSERHRYHVATVR
jgi:hypothetical protein